MATDCSKCPLRDRAGFKSVSDSKIDFLSRFKAGELTASPGTEILMQGTKSPQLFTVLDGLAVRQKTLQNGARQVINFVMPGDFLGLQAGVMNEMQHSVVATTPMKLCVFNRADLWGLFKAEPALAYDLTWLAAIEEHFLGEALAVIGQLPAIDRIVWGLRRFHARSRQAGLGEEFACPFPYRQHDLADALGLSLVHTNKTLQKLRAEGILSLENGQLRLLDTARINAMVDGDMSLPDGPRPLI